MRRTVLALVLAAVTVLGFATFAVGNASAWKCDRHPEKPNCTTTLPLNSTTSQPPVSVSQPSPSTSLPTTTTSTTVVPPVVVPPATPPLVSHNPPSVIRLAG